jgi:hypothetical protein
MPIIRLNFGVLYQGEQVNDADSPEADYLHSRIAFVLMDHNNKPRALQVFVRQPRGCNYSNEPLEIGPVEGPYDGPFSRPAFEELVERFYRQLVAESLAQFGGSEESVGRLDMSHNIFERHFTPIHVWADDVTRPSGAWLLPGERRVFRKMRPRAVPTDAGQLLETPKSDDDVPKS